jgi:hypothetical protein
MSYSDPIRPRALPHAPPLPKSLFRVPYKHPDQADAALRLQVSNAVGGLAELEQQVGRSGTMDTARDTIALTRIRCLLFMKQSFEQRALYDGVQDLVLYTVAPLEFMLATRPDGGPVSLSTVQEVHAELRDLLRALNPAHEATLAAVKYDAFRQLSGTAGSIAELRHFLMKWDGITKDSRAIVNERLGQLVSSCAGYVTGAQPEVDLRVVADALTRKVLEPILNGPPQAHGRAQATALVQRLQTHLRSLLYAASL